MLELWRPPKSWIKTQSFGQNATELYAKSGLAGHSAEDYMAPFDTPIPSLSDGKVFVIANKDNPDLDRYRAVYVVYEDQDGLWEVSYGHLNKIFVTEGQEVKAGDILGTMGNTGQVYTGGRAVTSEERQAGSKVGTHLHGPQVRPCTYITPQAIKALNYENGYNGCVNTEQFYNKYSIEDRTKVVNILLAIINIYKKLLK